MFRLKIFIFLLLPLLVISCRSTKNISYSKEVRDKLKINDDADKERLGELINSSVEKHNYEYRTWSAKINVDFSTKGSSRNITANVRIASDSIIWVSATALMGIEAARIKITPDSLLILNKIDQTILRRRYSDIKYISGLPLKFDQLEKLIAGIPLSLDSDLKSWEVIQQPLHVLLSHDNSSFKSTLTMEPVNLFIDSEEIKFSETIQAILSYGSYIENSGNRVATEREIKVEGTQQINIKMKVRDVLINEALSFPFSIPQNYIEI